MVERRPDTVDTRNAVRKAACLLRAMSLAGTDGHDLADLAATCMLPKSTVHRLLAALVQERLVTRVPGTRRYVRPDPVPPHIAIWQRQLTYSRHCRAVLAALPVGPKDAIFLMNRSGDEAVCFDAYFGCSIIPSLTRGVGGRVRLGVGPGATILLSSCDAPTIDRLLVSHSIARRENEIRIDLQQAKASGYITDRGLLIDGVGGVAVPVSHRTNRNVSFAIGVAFSIADHSPDFFERLGDCLLYAAEKISFLNL